jgi:hypothetical protein
LIVEQWFEIELPRSGATAIRPGSGCRFAASPASPGKKFDVGRLENLHLAVAASQRAAAPARFAVRAADAKRHERAAVVEVDADPIPADRIRCRGTRSTIRDRATLRR